MQFIAKPLNSSCEEGWNISEEDEDKGISNGLYVEQSKFEKHTSNIYSLANSFDKLTDICESKNSNQSTQTKLEIKMNLA